MSGGVGADSGNYSQGIGERKRAKPLVPNVNRGRREGGGVSTSRRRKYSAASRRMLSEIEKKGEKYNLHLLRKDSGEKV